MLWQVDKGRVKFTAEVNSIYTLTTLQTGQKGVAGKIPLPADFPLPYKDSFNGKLIKGQFHQRRSIRQSTELRLFLTDS